jgi:ammonia channel protein AmtB
MEYAIGNLVFMIFLFIIGLILYVVIARWVFKINKLVDLQERQIYILTMIARQQGVPGEALDSALGNSVDKLYKSYLTGFEKTKK